MSKSMISPLPLKIGLFASVERIIPREWTVAVYDARLPEVLSTPAMIGMMEVAAAKAVEPELPAGTITVGTRIEVDHLKAVHVGATVRAMARFIGYQGKFLGFEVEAKSGEQVIGRGKVYRAIVEASDVHKTAEKQSPA